MRTTPLLSRFPDFGETARQQRPRLGVPGARAAPAHFPLVPSAGPLGPLGHPDQWRLPSHISPPRLDL